MTPGNLFEQVESPLPMDDSHANI